MTCWKCGKSINFGSECDECSIGSNKYISANKYQQSKDKWVSIDWEKVKNIEDVKLILSCINIKVKKDDKDVIYIKLKEYLKKK